MHKYLRIDFILREYPFCYFFFFFFSSSSLISFLDLLLGLPKHCYLFKLGNDFICLLKLVFGCCSSLVVFGVYLRVLFFFYLNCWQKQGVLSWITWTTWFLWHMLGLGTCSKLACSFQYAVWISLWIMLHVNIDHLYLPLYQCGHQYRNMSLNIVTLCETKWGTTKA